MIFSTKESLSTEEIEDGLKYVLLDGLTTQTMLTLTSGIFLVAFALALGASNTVVGFISAIPPLAQLLQIFGLYIVYRVRNRRAITISATIIGRSFISIIVLIPVYFVTADPAALVILIISLILNSSFGAISACSWNSWMRDLIPTRRLGDFFSKRMRYQMTLNIMVFLAGGFYLSIVPILFPSQFSFQL